MQRRTFTKLLVAGAIAAGSIAATAAVASPRIGEPAPAFTAKDTEGKTVSLSDFKGKTVVLEWTNDECPYVRKHYGGNAMQALQKKWTAEGVVWLTLISSAPGEQGHVTPEKANMLTAERKAAPTDVLFDPTGRIGRAYAAQTTPHMFIIKGDGTLAYMGGIDDKPTTRLEDLKTAKNYVDAALTDIKAGRPVATATSRAYGCSIKYSS